MAKFISFSKFFLSVLLIVSLGFICGKDKEKSESSSKEDTKKESTKESTKETTKDDAKKESVKYSDESVTPILYFCESYGKNGEVGISDRFTTGYLTVMVKSNSALGLKNVKIQFDRYDDNTGKFKYYKKFDFVINPDDKFVYFAKTSGNDMSFDKTGIYRVFMLDSKGTTVASNLVQIIR